MFNLDCIYSLLNFYFKILHFQVYLIFFLYFHFLFPLKVVYLISRHFLLLTLYFIYLKIHNSLKLFYSEIRYLANNLIHIIFSLISSLFLLFISSRVEFILSIFKSCLPDKRN